MKIEQIYTGCLAEAAYYIESNGEVAIIDPLRETKPYTDRAAKNHSKIKYILETHFHADFVSGHLDLAKKTGATIVFGPTATPGYEAHIAADGEILQLGNLKIKVLHTPGHTMESTSYLLFDEQGRESAIFTGDTLFIGDVGRPDLVQKLKPEVTPQLLAGHLYESLRTKIMTLPDHVMVYPGHGAGSACGKNMSQETSDTLGNQKRLNYALNPSLTKQAFLAAILDGLAEPPQYFPSNVLMNLQGGIESIDTILTRGTHALTVREFLATWESTHAIVIDTRTPQAFASEHVPGSMFIGLDDHFAPWVGTLVPDLQQPILFISDKGREEEVVTRLSRVGYDHTIGFLAGGLNAWKEARQPIGSVQQISADHFANMFPFGQYNLLDVRRRSEYDAEHLVGAENFPLDLINTNMAMLSKDDTYYLHCAGGYRSMIAASILLMRGYKNIINIPGGYKSLSATPLRRSEHREQRSML